VEKNLHIFWSERFSVARAESLRASTGSFPYSNPSVLSPIIFIIMDKVVEAVAGTIQRRKNSWLGVTGLQDHPKGAISVCYSTHKFVNGVFSSRRNQIHLPPRNRFQAGKRPIRGGPVFFEKFSRDGPFFETGPFPSRLLQPNRMTSRHSIPSIQFQKAAMGLHYPSKKIFFLDSSHRIPPAASSPMIQSPSPSGIERR